MPPDYDATRYNFYLRLAQKIITSIVIHEGRAPATAFRLTQEDLCTEGVPVGLDPGLLLEAPDVLLATAGTRREAAVEERDTGLVRLVSARELRFPHFMMRV